MPISNIRHGKRAGFPGNSLCGLNDLRDGRMKFGRSKRGITCPECLAAIERLVSNSATNEKKFADERRAKQQRYLTDPTRGRGGR